MSFSKSLAGAFASGMRANPYATGAAVFGLGAGTFAGASTAMDTDGPFSQRVDAGAASGIAYGAGGMALAGGALVFSSYPGLTRPTGTVLGRSARGIGRRTGDYSRTLSSELRVAGGWRKTLTRAPVVMGLGAGIGALAGAKLDRDDPGHGAKIGAATGAVGGLVVSRVARASGAWKKLGGFRKTGFLAAAALAVGVAASAATPTEYGPVDQPSGVRGRMDAIGASGDIVFGLHNKR